MLLCTDLDRTVLPNGAQPESPGARPLFRKLARRPEVTLVYVSGRDRGLLRQAIKQFDIPEPDYAIGDVGTTIYDARGHDWTEWHDWRDAIAADWNGLAHDEIAGILDTVRALRMQEREKQNAFKISYYVDPGVVRDQLCAEVREKLLRYGVLASLIWSVDETVKLALMDVLPQSANKLHAVQFLMDRLDTSSDQVLFAGDSGNDLPVLTSGLQSVLVRNADEAVRAEAVRESELAGTRHALYLARGGFMDMNGNYAAGVLEGAAEFFPQVSEWLRAHP